MKRSILLAAVALSLGRLAFADVLIVDAGGAGDYLTIGDAYAAATAGDVLLIRPGIYSGGIFDGTPVTIAAEDPALMPDITTVDLRNMPAGSRVHCMGIEIRRFRTDECEASIRVEGCRVTDGAIVRDSSDCVFVRCLLEGDNGGFTFAGTKGVLAFGSRVGFYDCEVRGGRGGNADASQFGHVFRAGRGGHALHATSSDIYAMNTTFEGGDGGSGLPGNNYAGPGGWGVWADAMTMNIHMTSIPFMEGGLGGGGGAPSLDGGPTNFPIDFLGLPSRELLLPSVIREVEANTWTILGRPGDRVFLASSDLGDYRYLPSAHGLLGLAFAGPPTVTFLGIIDGSSQLDLPMTAPVLPMGIDSQLIDHQIFIISDDDTRILGELSPQLVLRTGF